MALTVLLKGTTLGADTGPFKVYHTSIDPLNQVGASSYTRNQLLGGITIADIPNNAPSLFIQSEGACTNFTEVAIVLPSATPSPSPTRSVTPSRTPSRTPSMTASVGASPSVTPSISVTASVTATPSITPSGTPSATPSRSPGASPPETPSVTPSITPTGSPSVTPSSSPIPSASPSKTPSMTMTPSATMLMGKCHSFTIPSEDLISGGNNLYIGYTPWGTETVLWTVYSSMVEIMDDDPSVWRSVVCGNRFSLVQFKYGSTGTPFSNSNWVVNSCNDCCSSETPCSEPSVTPTPTPTPSKSPLASSNWTVRNLDCSGGTVNTTAINGSSLTLAGPSTFPLSSTLYGTQTNPNGVVYGGSNTIQVGVTTNLPGTGNCGVLEVKVNGTIKASKYFTTDPFPSVTGVVINGGDSVEVVIRCMTGPCPPSPSPTPSNTPTPSVSPVVYVVNVEYGSDAQLLCSNGGVAATIYSPDASYLSDGAKYYYDAGFSVPMSDMSNYYKDQFGDYGMFGPDGTYISSGTCT